MKIQKTEASGMSCCGSAMSVLRCLSIFIVLLSGTFPVNPAEACDFYVYRALPFDGTEMQGCVSRRQVKAAYQRKIRLGSTEDDAYRFLFVQGEPRKIMNCSDYIKALKNGGTPRSNFDIAMGSFFISGCGALAAMEGSVTPKKTYIHGSNFPVTDKMPALLLHGLVGEVEEELEKASNEGRTLGNYAAITGREADHGHKTLQVVWEDLETAFNLVAEGDFNRDGYNDLLLFVSTHSRTGTLRAYEYLLLSMRERNQKMYDVYSSDKGCLYGNGGYVCSPKYRWNPLPKRDAND